MLYKIISIVLMCGGVSIGLAVVPYEDHQYTISDLHELFFNQRSYLFWGPTGALLLVGVIISEWLVKRNQKKPINVNLMVFPKWFMPTYVAFNQCTTELLLKSSTQMLVT